MTAALANRSQPRANRAKDTAYTPKPRTKKREKNGEHCWIRSIDLPIQPQLESRHGLTDLLHINTAPVFSDRFLGVGISDEEGVVGSWSLDFTEAHRQKKKKKIGAYWGF